MSFLVRRRTALLLAATATFPLAVLAVAQIAFSGDLIAAASDRSSLLAGALAVAIAFVIQMITVRRALRPIREMTRAAATLARGDYAARLPVGGDTDLDALARTFNQMAETLAAARAGLEDKVRERTQALEAVNLQMSHRNRELAERSEELARHRYREQAKGRALAALTADAELDEVIGAALCELAGPVGAAVMLCYKLEGRELCPIASYAATESARSTPVPLAGMAEHAMRKRRVEILEEVPPEIDLRFDCLVAAGRPRALVMVPLAVGNRPSGLLVVGSLGPFSNDAVTMLSDVAAPLALTIARRSLLDHTERIARELARRNQELAEQATALEAQGEELKAQQQELSRKNEEVQKADRLKSEFLANMSHELRTPLNAVIGFSELLLDDGAELGPTRRQWVDDIQASGRHLLTLINRVLDLAKIEAGHMPLSPEPVAPAEALASACGLIRASAQKKGISIEVAGGDAGAVLADRGRLQQILLNLLANAVKFSPDRSPIEAGFARQDRAVRFWVKDCGPGIPAETQKRLFQPFFQAESPLVKRHDGTGLGLAISRRLVEQQGGTMGVESAPGQGSTFFFTLPLAPADVTRLPQRGPVLVDGPDLNSGREMPRRGGAQP